MNEELIAMQASNVLVISRGATSIKDDDIGIKAILAASNHCCWELTSARTIRVKNDKWYVYLNQRKHKNFLKGKSIGSTGHLSRGAAEMDLFNFRLSKEVKKRRCIIQNKVQNISSRQGSTIPLETRTETNESPASSVTEASPQSTQNSTMLFTTT